MHTVISHVKQQVWMSWVKIENTTKKGKMKSSVEFLKEKVCKLQYLALYTKRFLECNNCNDIRFHFLSHILRHVILLSIWYIINCLSKWSIQCNCKIMLPQTLPWMMNRPKREQVILQCICYIPNSFESLGFYKISL